MSQRFTLFYAGFTANAPALYFNQLEFIGFCKNEGDELLKPFISKFSNTLQDKVVECTSNLKAAINLAEHFDMEILPEPQNPEEYFNWVFHYTECFEKAFPMARIDHYYYLFSRKIAEIICNMSLLETYIDLRLSYVSTLDLSKKMEKCLKDTEYILFKLMAAAALLSSEPRQNYFNVFYRSLCQEFTPLKGVNIMEIEESELKKVSSTVKEYDLVVMDGFKKCMSLLEELDI